MCLSGGPIPAGATAVPSDPPLYHLTPSCSGVHLREYAFCRALRLHGLTFCAAHCQFGSTAEEVDATSSAYSHAIFRAANQEHKL